MTSLPPTASEARFGLWTSLVMGGGILLSGPVGVGFVHLIGPQPSWSGVDRFVASFHPIQILPYVFGLALVWGSAGVVVAFTERTASRAARTIARLLVAAFVTLISLNYILQTTFVPSLVRGYTPSSAAMIEHLTMANPHSMGWALEMWGYGFLGVATWLVVPSAPETMLERACGRLLAANGMMSVIGAFGTMLRLEWVFSTVGFIAFATWNVLMLALACFSALYWRQRSFVSAPRFAS
jgi:hypothetical protein